MAFGLKFVPECQMLEAVREFRREREGRVPQELCFVNFNIMAVSYLIKRFINSEPAQFEPLQYKWLFKQIQETVRRDCITRILDHVSFCEII